MREIPGPPERLVLEDDFDGVAPEELFACWIDPDRLASWWAQGAEVDPKPGGEYVLSWPAIGWTLRGRVLEIDAPRSLAFTWAWDHEPHVPERRVRVDVEPRSGGSRLRITHGDYADPDGADAVERDSHREGWESFVEGLRDLLLDDV